jgi:hypothetical protein
MMKHLALAPLLLLSLVACESESVRLEKCPAQVDSLLNYTYSYAPYQSGACFTNGVVVLTAQSALDFGHFEGNDFMRDSVISPLSDTNWNQGLSGRSYFEKYSIFGDGRRNYMPLDSWIQAIAPKHGEASGEYWLVTLSTVWSVSIGQRKVRPVFFFDVRFSEMVEKNGEQYRLGRSYFPASLTPLPDGYALHLRLEKRSNSDNRTRIAKSQTITVTDGQVSSSLDSSYCFYYKFLPDAEWEKRGDCKTSPTYGEGMALDFYSPVVWYEE